MIWITVGARCSSSGHWLVTKTVAWAGPAQPRWPVLATRVSILVDWDQLVAVAPPRSASYKATLQCSEPATTHQPPAQAPSLEPPPPHLHHALSPTSLLQLYLCSAHIFTFKSPIPRFAFKYFFHTKCWIGGNYCSSLSLLRKFRNVSISTWSLGLLVIHLTTLEM